MASFELYQDSKEEYRWRLKARNGRTIATSGEGYKTERSCMNGIQSVIDNAGKATLVYCDEDG